MDKLYLSLIKINIFWLVIIVILILFVFSPKKVIKPIKKDLSPRTIHILEIVTRVALFVVAISIIYSTYLPVLQDTIWVFKQKEKWTIIPQKEGEVIRRSRALFGFWFLEQDIYFKGDNLSYKMFLMGEPVTKGSVYLIHYLPKSRSVVKIKKKEERGHDN